MGERAGGNSGGMDSHGLYKDPIGKNVEVQGKILAQIVALPDGKVAISTVQGIPPIDLVMVLSDLLATVVRNMREEGIREAQRIKVATGGEVMKVMKGGKG